MKKISLLLFGFALSMWTLPFALTAHADTGACYNVQDPDGRTACLARARGERSLCYSIQRSDMRALCLAEVKR